MKIIIIAGTETTKSRTRRISEKVSDSLRDKFGSESIIDIYDQNTLQARHCVGCCNCFLNGKCALDTKDNFSQLKEDLISSDLIYMISPVYFHQVSGTMKVFIDRLSYWTHILRLIGKVSVSVSVSSNNGNDFVNFYLNKFLSHLGTIVIDDIALLLDADSDDEVNEKISKSTDLVFQKIMSANEIKANQKQEIYFSVMQKQYRNIQTGFERTYWVDNGYFNCSTFDELWKVNLGRSMTKPDKE